MSFNILQTPEFSCELKRLSKKIYLDQSDLCQLLASLEKEPAAGQPLGNNCYKIRMAISSKNKGKSGCTDGEI